jgi:uncharacterized repeat protein (TIGR01451 family)
MGIRGKIFSIIIFLLFMIVSGGRGWCAPPPGAIIENKAAAAYADGNGNPYLAQSNTVQTATGVGPLFKIEQTASLNPVPPNQTVIFQITATNIGNASATGSVLTAQLPPGTSFVQADRNGVFSDGKVEWSLGNIDAGGSVTVNATVMVLPDTPLGATLPIRASIISAEGPAASSTIAPLVGVAANVSIALSADRTEVPAGSHILYTVTVINIGPVKIENLALNASLPQYADFTAASNNGSANGGVVSWNVAALLPDEKINYTFETRVFTSTLDGTVVTSSATIAAAQLASRTSNAADVLVKNKQAIVLTSDPQTIIANGTDISILTARAVDSSGNPLPDGTPIRFFTDQGTFLDGGSPSSTVTVPISGGNGEAKTPLTAPLLTHPATAHVQASIGLLASNIVELKILPGAASIYVYDLANKRAITASDQNYTINIIIENYPRSVTVDANGLWIIPRLEPGNYKIYTIVTDKTGREIIRTPEKTITIEQNTVTELPMNSIEGKLEERDGSKIYAGVKVNLYDATGRFIAETTTDNNGIYRFPDITPGNFYRINARLNDGRSVILTTPYFTKRTGVILVAANLLVDPYGVVYDSITGAPLAGVTVWILNPDGTPATLPDPTEAPGAVNTNPLITGADGTYQWPLIAPGDYKLNVLPTAGSGYTFPSLNPAPFMPLNRGSKGEVFSLVWEIVNINVPLDPSLPSLVIKKTADKITAEIGDFVTYKIEVQNNGATTVTGLKIIDNLPASFHYVGDSSRLGGRKVADPEGTAVLTWNPGNLTPGQKIVLSYKLRIGVDPYAASTNSAQAVGINAGRVVSSNSASVTIKVSRGIFVTESLIFGRVFRDKNKDGVITEEDQGVPAVRLYLEDGTSVTTDREGKFSLYGIRKGNHLLKLDATTLPPGLIPLVGSNRNAGDGASLFVDLREGEPFKANFPLTGKEAPPEKKMAEPVPSLAEEKAPSESVEDILSKLDNKLEIMGPKDKETILNGKTTVTVKGSTDLAPTLLVNGVPVGEERIGERTVDTSKKLFLYKYISVSLQAGANHLRAVGKDEFGNVREAHEITLLVPGSPKAIILAADKKENIADGKSLTAVKVTIRDKEGRLIAGHIPFTVDITKGTIKQPDANPDLPGIQLMSNNGEAFFEIVSPENAGDGEVVVSLESLSEKMDIYYLPNLRPMIIVGIGEGTIGWNRITGNLRKTEAGDDYHDGYYADGKLAFFLKGKVLGKYLLTAAYDSGKSKEERLFRDLDPNKYYPVYGDESSISRDAESARKLYIKVERDKSYLMFGDFNTDMKEKELAAYTRAFNGVKGRWQTERVTALFFATKTERVRVVEEIAARGVSGYYYIAKQPLVEGSEKITLVTRDRVHADRVIAAKEQTRYNDYDINYEEGSLLFKTPLSGYDSNFNPVFIRVEYESTASGEQNYIFGGTADVRITSRLTVGATKIIEQNGVKDYDLQGVNARFQVSKEIALSAEAAASDSPEHGEGYSYKMDLKGKIGERMAGKFYLIKMDRDFFNPNSLINRGLEKYGFEVAYKLSPSGQFFSEVFHEEDGLTENKNRLYSAGYRKELDKFSLEAQLRRYEHHDPLQREDIVSDAIKGKIKAQVYEKTTLTAERIQDVGDLTRQETTLGVDQKLGEKTTGYAKYKFGNLFTESLNPTGEGYKSQIFLLGINTDITRDTTIYSEYLVESAIGGKEDLAKIGMKNRWVVGKNLMANTSIEQVRAIASNHKTKDYTALTGGMEYLPRKDLKSTTRYEVRSASTETSHLFTQGLTWKFHKDMSLLFSEKFSYQDGRGDTPDDKVRSEAVLGLAYRPTAHDKLNAFFKLSSKYIADDAQFPGIKAIINSASLEGVQQLDKKSRLALKYAFKQVVENTPDSTYKTYTDLVVGKITRDITEKWDASLIGRALHQYESKDILYSTGFEVGYGAAENLWVSLGYNFKGLKEDKYSRSEYTTQGIYFNFKFKFDEKTSNKLTKKKVR